MNTERVERSTRRIWSEPTPYELQPPPGHREPVNSEWFEGKGSVHPDWYMLKGQEEQLVTSAELLDKLLGVQSRYKRNFGQQWWGGDYLEGLVGKWQKKRLSFRQTVWRARQLYGREHPDTNLLARVEHMLRQPGA